MFKSKNTYLSCLYQKAQPYPFLRSKRPFPFPPIPPANRFARKQYFLHTSRTAKIKKKKKNKRKTFFHTINLSQLRFLPIDDRFSIKYGLAEKKKKQKKASYIAIVSNWDKKYINSERVFFFFFSSAPQWCCCPLCMVDVRQTNEKYKRKYAEKGPLWTFCPFC